MGMAFVLNGFGAIQLELWLYRLGRSENVPEVLDLLCLGRANLAASPKQFARAHAKNQRSSSTMRRQITKTPLYQFDRC